MHVCIQGNRMYWGFGDGIKSGLLMSGFSREDTRNLGGGFFS